MGSRTKSPLLGNPPGGHRHNLGRRWTQAADRYINWDIAIPSIWTHNLKVAHSLARKIKAGTICVNSHNYGDPPWPFGGFKQSGWGREMGKEVMEH